ITFEPHRSKLVGDRAHVLFDSARIPGEIVDCLVVRKSFLESKRQTVKALIQSWFETRDYLNDHRQAACEKMAPREQVSPEAMERSLSLIEIPSLERNKELLETKRERTYESFKAMEREMRAAGISTGALPGIESLDGGALP